MFCFNCFPNKDKDKELNEIEKNKRIVLKYNSKKHYTTKPIQKNELNTSENPYKFEEHLFIPFKYESINYPWIQVRFFKIPKLFSEETIPLLYISNRNSSNTVIIYSQTQSSDLGKIFPILIDMSSQLKCDIIAYDYTNPEKNNYTSLEKSYVTDLEEVIDFSKEHLNIQLHNIILMSKSLGSIPVLGVSSKEEFRDLKGIVLISPIVRGFTLRFNNFTDNYDVLQKANMISSRTFIIHGKMDNVIKLDQSEILSKAIRYVTKWYPSKENHSNLFTRYRNKFYTNIKKFITELDNSTSCSKIEYENSFWKRSSISINTKPNETKESTEFSSDKKRSNTISNISRKNEIIPMNLMTPNLIDLLDEEYDITEKTIDF